jgi:hypothetical protein
MLVSRVRSLPSCILENNAGDSLLLNGLMASRCSFFLKDHRVFILRTSCDVSMKFDSLSQFFIAWVCSIVHGEPGQSEDTGYDDQQLIMKVLNIVFLIVYFGD